MKLNREFFKTIGFPVSRDHPNHDPRLPVAADVLREALAKPRGVTKTGIRYRGAISNASGRDDTAVINAVPNMLVQLAAWTLVAAGNGTPVTYKEFDLMGDGALAALMGKMRIAVLGDDSLCTVPEQWGPWTSAVESVVQRSGFECKISVEADVRKVVFLGQRPYPTTRGLRWAPTIGRRVYKQQVCLRPSPDVRNWLRSTSVALLDAYPFWPIGRAIAAHGIVHTAGCGGPLPPEALKGSIGPWDVMRANLKEAAQTCPETWSMIEAVYGLSEAQVREAEELLANVPTMRADIRNSVVERTLVVDEC